MKIYTSSCLIRFSACSLSVAYQGVQQDLVNYLQIARRKLSNGLSVKNQEHNPYGNEVQSDYSFVNQFMLKKLNTTARSNTLNDAFNVLYI